ncbi:MAG: type I-E CRISPR-associated protein Cse1/CasA, partial [Candidatus Methylomirabilis sp.]|nr:type I-E CRISPR-associated protein Cse1/CasA [Deltaproteobacteria bacterium]
MGDTDDGKTTLGAEFNLLVEPWIPVLLRDGRADRVGIRRALTEAGMIRQIAASNPMDRVALLRLLLAVLQWCKPTPTDRELASLREDGCAGIPEKWLDAKLGTPEAPNAAFELWPERGNGFLQTASRDKKATEPPTYLLHEFPVGTNIAHFRHARDDAATICPACAALGLVRAPLFTTQGGSGKSPGINDKPPIYFVPTGLTLLDTLLLQWPFEVVAYDRPAWERKPNRKPTDPVGVLEGFTWLPRRVRLQASRSTGGPCAVCSLTEDGGAFVTRIVFEGDPGSKKDEKSGLVWRDPHVAYPEPKSPKTDGVLRAANSLGMLGSALGQWRRLSTSALASESDQARPPAALQSAAKRARAAEYVEVEACGFASDQMKYMECWSRSLKLPLGDAMLDADRA